MSATDIRQVLEAAANQILAVAAPLTARIVRAHVSLDATADTAATDGIRIWVPPIFAGVDVTRETPVAIGLLVHELGHFLQPLKALEEAVKRCQAPHWLANILADIQLEAMMAGLFPPLAETLVAVRAAVKAAHLADYRKGVAEGKNFPAIACGLALLGRFGDPAHPFDIGPNGGSQELLPAVKRIADSAVADRALPFAWRLSAAAQLAPAQLPAYIEETIACFPELAQAPETFPVPGGALRVVGAAGQAAQDEAASSVSEHPPAKPTSVAAVRCTRRRPLPAAAQAALGLRVHFQSARAATEIVAPGKLDRRALACGELVPLRMALPGKETPRPRAVICVDKSSSMKGKKLELAQLAAQAVAIAIRSAGGEAVGVLFDDKAQVADSGDEALLTFDPRAISYGGTDFGFLADAWRRWPEHIVLVVTDGQGVVPPAFPGDKARTAVILIPPDCDADLMGQVAGRAVTLSDLRGLTDVMTLLMPRRAIT